MLLLRLSTDLVLNVCCASHWPITELLSASLAQKAISARLVRIRFELLQLNSRIWGKGVSVIIHTAWNHQKQKAGHPSQKCAFRS